MSDQKPRTPVEIDDIEDRMGSIEQLDFSDRKDERRGRIGDTVEQDQLADEFPPQRVSEAGMSGGETVDGHTTMDDLAPETLIPDDGSRSPSERGHGGPADQQLSEVSAHEINAGIDLDEAERARQDPLDGKPWDGPADGDEDTGVSGGDAVLHEDEGVLSDEELEGEAPLDSARDRKP